MISSLQLVTILTSLISLALLLFILRLWATLRLDEFRQSMFALRDEMFDYAADGNISFDDPAYTLLRKSMNGFIRYAHHLTFFRLSVMMIYWWIFKNTPPTNWWDSWTSALENVPNCEVRRDLQCFHQRANRLVGDRVIFGSPILLCALVFAVCSVGFISLASARAQWFAKFIDPRVLDEEAVAAA